MVDPVNITDYNLSDERLEEYLLFCIAASGKNAVVTSRILDRLLLHLHQEADVVGWRPFAAIRRFDQQHLAGLMKGFGIGCYSMKSRGFAEAARKRLDLRTCSPHDLEEIPGIGRKTSRLFILHTRRNAKVACLDVHILRWLRDQGYDVPKVSPQSRKKYVEVENLFLGIARKRRTSPATLDLAVWRAYAEIPA